MGQIFTPPESHLALIESTVDRPAEENSSWVAVVAFPLAPGCFGKWGHENKLIQNRLMLFREPGACGNFNSGSRSKMLTSGQCGE